MKRSCAVAAIMGLGSLQSWAQDPLPIIPLVLSGQPAPGTSQGTVFSSIPACMVNAAGEVIFTANLAGPDISADNNQGVWVKQGALLQLVARTGSSAPGANAAFRYMGLPQLDDAGQVTLDAALSSPGGTGIWTGSPATLQLLARDGGTPPPGAGLTYRIFRSIYAAGGSVLFTADMSGSGVPSVGDAVFLSSGGTVRTIAAHHVPAPDLPAGVQFGGALGMGGLAPSGQFAFHATLAGAGVDNTNDNAAYAGSAEGLHLVARAGDPAAGLPPGLNYGYVSVPSIGSAGQVSFSSSIVDNGTGQFIGEGMWMGRPGEMQLVARSGMPAPGLPDGIAWDGGFGTLPSSASGRTVLRGFIAGTGVDDFSDEALWFGLPGQFELLAREGDHAPGTPAGVHFSQSLDDHEFSPFSRIILNAAGRVAFAGRLAGPDITAANADGIWATDPSGQLLLVARDGDLLEVMPGDFRTIQWLSLCGYGDRQTDHFSDRGDVAFVAWFTDGSSGIFSVTVPEPASLGLCAAALLLRRRHRCACAQA